jgi:hypothetical protein
MSISLSEPFGQRLPQTPYPRDLAALCLFTLLGLMLSLAVLSCLSLSSEMISVLIAG